MANRKKSSLKKREKIMKKLSKAGKFVWKHKGKILKGAAVLGAAALAAHQRKSLSKVTHAAQPHYSIRR